MGHLAGYLDSWSHFVGRAHQRGDAVEVGMLGFLGDLGVISGLKVDPEHFGCAKGAGQAQGGRRGDGALALDDLPDTGLI